MAHMPVAETSRLTELQRHHRSSVTQEGYCYAGVRRVGALEAIRQEAVAKRSRVWEGTGLGWTSRPCWRWDLGGLAVLTIHRAGAWTGLSGLGQ